MKKINFKKGKKYFIGGLVLVLLLVLIVVMVKNKRIEINFDENGSAIAPEKMWYESQKQYMEKIVTWQDKLLEMQASDDFGGATPEETMDAFIEALKKGDTELASRYFVFNKQAQMAEELAIGKKNGVLDLLIDDLGKRNNGNFYAGRDDKYEFVVIGNDGEWDDAVEFSFDLVKNSETQVWKIESL